MKIKPPGWARTREAVIDSAVLGLACLATWLLVTQLLARVPGVSDADHLLGAMWAVLATIFVNRASVAETHTAAVSRLAATLISFVYCLVYLSLTPFHTWALPVLVALSALTATLLGRPGDAITAAITTTVVLVVAAVSPHNAWLQPILRFADTAVGTAVGVGSAWLHQRLVKPGPHH
ncbi:MAG TPA: FUSC family protein [Trebonia sp.]|nr:FUSC family protein [Trebonia sp.]